MRTHVPQLQPTGTVKLRQTTVPTFTIAGKSEQPFVYLQEGDPTSLLSLESARFLAKGHFPLRAETREELERHAPKVPMALADEQTKLAYGAAAIRTLLACVEQAPLSNC